jgi:hypothetical protein
LNEPLAAKTELNLEKLGEDIQFLEGCFPGIDLYVLNSLRSIHTKLTHLEQYRNRVGKCMTAELLEALEDYGGCDHSVGICYCHLTDTLEEAVRVFGTPTNDVGKNYCGECRQDSTKPERKVDG